MALVTTMATSPLVHLLVRTPSSAPEAGGAYAAVNSAR
jgi:hypothetical protein